MPGSDYRVRFVGDLGNLAQFSASIRGAYSSISSAYRTSASAPVTSIRSPSLQTSGLTTQIDAYNRTLTQSGQVFHRYVSGYTADMKRLEVSARSLGVGGSGYNTGRGKYGSFGTRLDSAGRAIVSGKDIKPIYDTFATGQYKVVTADLDRVEAAQKRLIPLERQLAAIEKQRIFQLAQINALQGNAILRKGDLETTRYRAGTKVNALSDIAGGTVGHMKVDPSGPEYKKLLDRKILAPLPGALPGSPHVMQNLFKTDADLNNAIRLNQIAPDQRIQQGLASIRKLGPVRAIYNAATNDLVLLESDISTYKAQEQKVINSATRKSNAAKRKAAPQLAALDDALNNSIAPISKDLDFLLQKSKGFRKNFIRQLGITAPYLEPIADAPVGASAAEKSRVRAQQARIAPQREAFAKELLARGITPDSVKMNYDYERGVYGVTAAVNGLNGVQGRLSATFDKNLNQLETNGRGLRGYGGFLRQTGKDLQKVLEWTVATTLVFGALGLAIGSISKINQVNMDLERFAIAARTSREETDSLFKSVAQIAQETATPLVELTAVMDDIAIATRKAGQTSEQWRASILDLTKAVGILTNLTGVDTVRATDLLSAAYKQLQIQPKQIIGVLNKVSAVAGGNAKSIEDIVSALGSVSTAAQAAGLSLDEQISSVQVLSQVTNKSSSDLATSFKNLFGAISSPGSVKILDKFGISVRNVNGELRPFLEIYKDIYDARQSGKISDGNFQDVLRGISGGPRRAPDAAALLENMPLIWEQLTKSVNATNEALIANARIIETNSAKLQKIKSAFDATLIQNFTDTVNKLVSALVTLGTALTDIFGGLNVSGLVSGVTQLLLMIAAMVALNKLLGPGGFLRRGIRGLRDDFGDLISKEAAFASQYSKAQIVRLGQGPASLPSYRGNKPVKGFGPNTTAQVDASIAGLAGRYGKIGSVSWDSVSGTAQTGAYDDGVKGNILLNRNPKMFAGLGLNQVVEHEYGHRVADVISRQGVVARARLGYVSMRARLKSPTVYGRGSPGEAFADLFQRVNAGGVIPKGQEGNARRMRALLDRYAVGVPTGGALPPIPGLRVVGPSGVPKVAPKASKLPAGYTPAIPGFVGPYAPLGYTPTGKIKSLPPRQGYKVVGAIGNQQYILKPAPGFKVVGPIGNQTYVANPTPAANQMYETTTPVVGKLPKDYNPKNAYPTLTPIKGYEIKPDANGNQQYHLKPVKGFDVVGPLGNQRLMPKTPVPKGVVIQQGSGVGSTLRAEAELLKNRTLGSSKGRMALGAGAGVAAAAGLAGIGTLVGGKGSGALGTVATIGQSIGPMLMLLGGPATIAAGVALTALSTGLQILNDEEQKQIQTQKNLKLSIYDEIKALQEQRRAVETAGAAQKAAGEVMQSFKGNTKLTVEETNQLSQAQKAYVEASFDLIDANSQIAQSIEELTILIPQLKDAYGGLSAKALTGFGPDALKKLAAQLAQDILDITVPGASATTKYTPVKSGTPQSIVLGKSVFGGNDTPLSSEQFSSKIGSPQDAIDFLRGAESGNILNGKVIPSGFEFNKQTADAFRLQLMKTEARDIDGFNEAIGLFGKYVNMINLPGDQLFNALNAQAAIVQSKLAVGGLLSGKADDKQTQDQGTNAAARIAVAQKIFSSDVVRALNATDEYFATRTVGETPRANMPTVSGMATTLFGPDGISGLIGDSSLGMDMTMRKAEELLEIYKLYHPELAGLVAGTQEYKLAAYELWTGVSYMISDVDEKTKAASEDMVAASDAILAAANASKMSLYEELSSLYGQRNSPDYKGKEGQEKYNAEENRIKQSISATNALGQAFAANVEYLDEYKAALGELHYLQGIQLIEDNSQLGDALMATAKRLGLTGHQIKILKGQLVNLLSAMREVKNVKAVFNVEANMPTAQFKDYLLKLRATVMAVLVASKSLPAGAPLASSIVAMNSAALNAINRALAYVSKEQNYQSGVNASLGSGSAGGGSSSSGGGSHAGRGGSAYNKPGLLDVPEEFKGQDRSVASLLAEAVKNARKLQSQVPGETKANRKEIVAILDGTKKVLQTKGIGEEYLRRAMEELTNEIKKQNDLMLKTDQISRIRVGAGSFAAIANVPVSAMGISTGGPGQPINVNLNVNGQILTPAQLEQLANLIAAQIKKGMLHN